MVTKVFEQLKAYEKEAGFSAFIWRYSVRFTGLFTSVYLLLLSVTSGSYSFTRDDLKVLSVVIVVMYAGVVATERISSIIMAFINKSQR